MITKSHLAITAKVKILRVRKINIERPLGGAFMSDIEERLSDIEAHKNMDL